MQQQLAKFFHGDFLERYKLHKGNIDLDRGYDLGNV